MAAGGASVAFAVGEFVLEFLASVGAAKVRRAAAAPKKIACPNRMGNSPFSKANAFFFLKRIVEIFGNAGECWQRLLNALQTAGATAARARLDEFCSLIGNQFLRPCVGLASCRRHGVM